MMNLTTRQQHVLDTLINYQRKHGFPYKYRIGRAAGMQLS